MFEPVIYKFSVTDKCFDNLVKQKPYKNDVVILTLI